ncbi:ABC transporter permease [Pseudonocardia sp.]|uniref:ABC transporter permease n=1 Tax=Pseudonocardia sp. TaxID=60912 RepID=UPI003D11F1CF
MTGNQLQDPPLAAGIEAAAVPDPVARADGRRPSLWRRLRRARVLYWAAIAWLSVLAAVALFANLLPIADPAEFVGRPFTPPGWSFPEPLGTDNSGRSQLSRLVFGARQSLAVGLLSVLLAMAVGTAIGMAAGFWRGKVDRVLSLLIDSMLAFPPLVLLLALAAALQPTISTIVVALAVLLTPTFARLTRGSTLAYRSREFILAARALGAGTPRLLGRELLPNVLLTVSSYFFVVVATAIVAEGSLSFLGLGIPPPAPSWGGMISDARSSLSLHPEQVAIPATVFVLTVMALNVVGEHVRRRIEGSGPAAG